MTNLLKKCLESVKTADGVYAEFGVLFGDTFISILEAATKSGKIAYAFDSFRGMPEPTEKDGELGKQQYPKGRFDMGGPGPFVDKMNKSGYRKYVVVSGFIPETLNRAKDLNFAFARVDLDHYYPTKCVLEFLLPRINKDSVVLCDDYFEKDNLASQAYKEFLSEHKDELTGIVIEGREMCFRKLG